MTQNAKDQHIYLRTIDSGERTSLSVLAGLIERGSRVLDLGCGSGSLGRYLQETRDCTSDGVTWSETEARMARPHYDQVEVADLESCDLISMFGTQRYDVIVCADVLEHLRQPERVLAQCRSLLKDGGRVLISVPNAAYAGLIGELSQGEFLYREEGLLDRTHLRFFTRRSLGRFLGEERWAVKSLDTIQRELPESEFRVAFDQLPPAAARYLLGTPDALTYQFIVEAHPVEAVVDNHHAVQVEARAIGPESAGAGFTAQLYLGRDGHYEEDDKRSAVGRIGLTRQVLRFSLPAQSSERPFTQIRFDPADRPGFIHLHGMVLTNAAGDTLWSWQAGQGARPLLESAAHQQIVGGDMLPAVAAAALLLLTGDDPWLELPVPAQALALANGGALAVDLGWPMSADYLTLAGSVQPLQRRVAELGDELHHAQTVVQDRDATLRELHEQMAAKHQALMDAEALQAKERHKLESLVEKERTLAAETRNLHAGEQREIAHLRGALSNVERERTRLQQEYAQLVDTVKAVENSAVYRLSRPVARMKKHIDYWRGRGPHPDAAAQAAAHTAVSTAPAAQRITPPDHPVDVIVPVYRGLADTQLCIDSVLASPVRVPYRLVVINDCSPEPEVTQWLRDRAAQDSRILLLENPENLGFVGTVNRGMALSDSHDVLLLNSDTEVANDWLDRIRAAAYGDLRIASVTPFSTNATICSYPEFCKDNARPPGYDTARIDALCARTHPGAVVDVPTGVGFCMYIRRDSLQHVGLFDTENFGKGYGEENDFCQRAAQAGWRNLHLLDTFVLHTGGVSFGDSKSPREQAAMATLARLHPQYARDVHAFVQADPARPYRLALDVARIVESGLPVILNVLHDRAGGTVRHVRELAAHLADKAVLLTLTPGPGYTVVLRFARKEEGFELTFQSGSQQAELLDVLRRLGVGHVHFHHLLGHDPIIRDLPHLLNVTYDFTAHDYFSYCTHITLTGTKDRYVEELGPGQCGCCPPDMGAPSHGNVAHWRAANARLLVGARHVLAPSHDTARRIAAFAPAVTVLPIPHTDVTDVASLPLPAPRLVPAQASLKIVVIGALSAIKGADVLEAVAMEAARRKVPIEFHLIGFAYRQLQTQPRARLTVHGGYAEEDLPGLIEWLQPDLAWFPAQWPETYSYTLSAALQAGLPVAVGDLGAFAERVAGRPWSWICDWDQQPKEWVDTFLAMRNAHFVTGEAPSLAHTQPQPLPPMDAPDWHYESHYLQGLTRPVASEPGAGQLFAPGELERFVAQPTAADHAKSGVLDAIVFLRSLPLLRKVAQQVPPHWRRRVKSWLQR
ncbi:methyltransferase domain-containing protein [Acidovorax sp. Leaf160]|uniref:methyltransferase domain-containing protein n=1 Tax=Acidovorax sp. Leaf160 TaxID=1736280 RepID=UPI0006F6921E|nr:methyltransferase domain-containing protein [Acidovorax sp. Leaf160]KQR41384.1 glycosyl transferase family 2 [Acidovorax sp. Leaf160]